MKKPKDNGGTAFPAHGGGTNGMSLRDYFAAAAMQGLLAACRPGYEYTGDNGPQRCAAEAYRYADAMIAARKEEA
jgi:hypothetical protein